MLKESMSPGGEIKSGKMGSKIYCVILHALSKHNVATIQARNQDCMWGGANEAKADPTAEMYFLSSDPFI